jgi:hypothetical protein
MHVRLYSEERMCVHKVMKINGFLNNIKTLIFIR